MKKAVGIITDPNIMFGKPVIAGTRILVETILDKLTAGQTREEILEAYPKLKKQDITSALEYASRLVKKVTPARANDRATLHKISH